MKNLLALICLTVLSSSSVFAFSRGPYLPKLESIKVPHGSLVYQQGADESGEYRDLDVTRDGYTFLGEAIVQLLDGRFQIITLRYTCESIDDGAYGALACDSAVFVRSYPAVYESCEFAHDSYWCE